MYLAIHATCEAVTEKSQAKQGRNWRDNSLLINFDSHMLCYATGCLKKVMAAFRRGMKPVFFLPAPALVIFKNRLRLYPKIGHKRIFFLVNFFFWEPDSYFF